MNNRITGIDLTRVFSIFGMMVVNYHFTFGAFQGNKILIELANFFSGRASATFVIIAGVGLILFAKSVRENPSDKKNLDEKMSIIRKRSLFLLLLGTLDLILWSADILRSYGVFFFIASFFILRKKNFF